MEYPGHEQVPEWDCGVACGSFTCYTTLLTLKTWILMTSCLPVHSFMDDALGVVFKTLYGFFLR